MKLVSFLKGEVYALPVVFKQGQRFGQFDVDTVDDTAFEPHGDITIRINGHHQYVIAPTNFHATVRVWDNDAPGGLSIIALEDSVTEGGIARFRIYSDQPAAMNLDVLLDLEVQGEYFSGDSPGQVRIDYLDRYVDVEIRTQGDDIHELNGSITLNLLPHQDYTLAPDLSDSASIQVLDNDSPVGISVLPATNSIVEGELARFIVSADDAIAQSRIIKLDVTQGANEDFLVW